MPLKNLGSLTRSPDDQRDARALYSWTSPRPAPSSATCSARRRSTIGAGSLIFAAPPAEIAVHPLEPNNDDEPAESVELYLMCDDLDETIAELRLKDVEVTRPIEERRYGRFTALRIPGGNEPGLYEPKHPTALSLWAPASS